MPERAVTYAQPVTVAAGSRVALVVSRGPYETPPRAFVDVPEVVGMTQGAALSRLQAAGVHPRVVNDYSSKNARGRVMGQLPSAGVNAAEGSEVVLLVSTGPAETLAAGVALPDVVGLTEAQAVAQLEAARLAPFVIYDYSRTVPAGIVMDQLPNSTWTEDTERRPPTWWLWLLAALAALALVVIAVLLLANRTTTVPNVVGLTQAEAVDRLRDADLQLGSVTQTQTTEVAEGNVAAQAPQAGERVRPGSAVAIAIAGEEPLVSVPNLRGATQAQAVSRLNELGLNAETRVTTDDRAPAGTVIEQDPAAGASVPPGATVTVVIAESPQAEEVQVPQVTDIIRINAETALEQLGLRVLVVENPSATVAEGVVIAQLPEAGETVPAGSTIAVVVSVGAPADATTVAAPVVTGDELPDAQEEIARAGLRSQPVAIEGTDEDANEVIAQWPAGGEAVPPDSTMVVLYAR